MTSSRSYLDFPPEILFILLLPLVVMAIAFGAEWWLARKLNKDATSDDNHVTELGKK